jgi:polysaccharide biosynthesis protein PslG
MKGVRRLVAIAMVGAAVLGSAAPARAAVPDGFVGLSSEELIDARPKAREASLEAQAAAGVRTLRQTFDWARIERSRGRYDLSEYDPLVLDAAEQGIRVLPVLFNPPRFRSTRPRRRARRGVYPPRRYSDMGRFAEVLARRYGARGTLWQTRPGLARRAVRSWQVWNEPNLQVYWESGVSPAQYVRLSAAVRRAIKRADPGAEIVSAGLPQSTLRRSMTFERFVAGMYRAPGKAPFDTLAVHPYARTNRGTVLAAKLARRLMNRYGDRDGGIWITEIGWASGGPPSSFRAGSKGQAALVGRALRGLGAERTRLGLRGVVYFKWRDTRLRRGIRDFWGHHTGLLTASGKRKRAFFAFRRAARDLAR